MNNFKEEKKRMKKSLVDSSRWKGEKERILSEDSCLRLRLLWFVFLPFHSPFTSSSQSSTESPHPPGSDPPEAPPIHGTPRALLLPDKLGSSSVILGSTETQSPSLEFLSTFQNLKRKHNNKSNKQPQANASSSLCANFVPISNS